MSPPRVAARSLQATLESRLGARLADALSAGQPALPPDIAERLRFARQTALARAQAARQRAPQARPASAGVPAWARATATAGAGGPTLGEAVPWWQRAAAVLPLLVLVAGLVGIEQWAAQERIATTADIDVALLADDLPPEAYADPGFVEFLRNEPADAAP